MALTNQALLTIIEYARDHLTAVDYAVGDIVVDHESDPYFYIFETGSYSVETHLLSGDNYEIGNITAPDIMGEGVLFGHTEKAVRIISELPGKAYKLTKEDIEKINQADPSFQNRLTTVSLLSSNNRIMESNIERMLLYTMSNYLETHTRNILPLLTSMKQLFSIHEVLWIERHEILEELYILRYSSESQTPINTKIDMTPYHETLGVCIRDFSQKSGCSFLFPIQKQNSAYGYIVLIHPEKEILPGYIGRVFRHMNSLFVEVIEQEWHRQSGLS